MEQILEEIYFKDPEKWQREANRLGGLEICDDKTGWPIWTLYPSYENGGY